jgi:predicted transcriptional regulator
MDEARLNTMTTRIVAAFVGQNQIPVADLPRLILSVHGALKHIDEPVAEPEAAEALKPAVPIRRSITPDYIVCLEDGRKLKTLKRHLAAAYGLTPEQYRRRWGLPADYPMNAANYSKERSETAKRRGLGRRDPAAPEEPAVAEVPRRAASPRRSRTA